MPPPDATKNHIIAAALLGALIEARWRSGDLLSRKSAELAPDLLRGHAAEMAFSPIGRDQVLSLALSAAADDLEAGRLPSDERASFLRAPGPDDSARSGIRRRTILLGASGGSEARGVVEELERRYRPECRNELELSGRLNEDAVLHDLLWDDPRLPCEDPVRLVMLSSGSKLVERAGVLAARGHSASPATRESPKPAELRQSWTFALRAALRMR